MGFQQGLSGLNAASKNLDTIGNNVANAGTVGFKQSQAQFADVFANSLAGGGGLQIGIGTRVADVVQQFSQGNISVTNNPLDMAVNGKGFFRMSQNGAFTYTRNGQFQLDKDGFIVNSNSQRLTGYLADANGKIVASSPQELKITATDLPPRATGTGVVNPGVQIQVNLDSRAPVISVAFDPKDPTTYNSSTALSIYDSLGNPHTYSLYFIKKDVNKWDVQATSTNPLGKVTDLGLLGKLEFKTDGTIKTATPPLPFPETISAADLGTGAADLNFNVEFAGTTQYGSPFGVNALNQDGYTSGRLAGFSASSEGIIQGRYTNGQTRNLGQVVLANFINPNGLQPLGGNQFAETADSGQPLVGPPGSSSLGILQSAAVEDSNVDMTAELVNMITAQRVYQANAQTIKTQDAVLQTLVNLR